MKKKTLSLLLALVLCLALVAPAFAATYEIPDTYHSLYNRPLFDDMVTIHANQVTTAPQASLGALTSETMQTFWHPVDVYQTLGATYLYITHPWDYTYMYAYYSTDWSQLRANNRTIVERDHGNSHAAVYAFTKTGVYVVEMMFSDIPAKAIFAIEVTNDGSLPPVEKPIAPEEVITPTIGEAVTLPLLPEFPEALVMIGRVLDTFRVPVRSGGKETTLTVYQLPEDGCLLGAILPRGTYLPLSYAGCYSLKNGAYAENTAVDWSGSCDTLYGPGSDEHEINRARMSGHPLTNIYGLRLGLSTTFYYTFADLSAYEKAIPTTTTFTDVAANAYYVQPVAWAVDLGVTTGTTETTFSPDATCTNAQILTFMWRACGSPAPMGDAQFTNLTGNEYYATAANWAYGEGLIEGRRAFDANTPCTRAMTMNYFWRLENRPEPTAPAGFADVPASSPYADAVAWAVEAGITTGTSAAAFSPDATCTRGQIVTFLYRAMQ